MSSVSVRLYLKKGVLLEEPAPHTREHRYYFNKIGIDCDKDRLPYYSMDLLEDEFPEALQEFIEKVSIRSSTSMIASRKAGRYSYLTAKGFVEKISYNLIASLIMVTGPNFNDAKDLYFKILSGKILPSEDWEGKQISE